MVTLIQQASEVLLAVAALCGVFRLLRGPDVVDRLVALEKLAMVLVGFLLLEVSISGLRLYTDAALALALFSFVLTVFVANYLVELAQ